MLAGYQSRITLTVIQSVLKARSRRLRTLKFDHGQQVEKTTRSRLLSRYFLEIKYAVSDRH